MEIIAFEQDAYGRTVAVINIDNNCLNAELVRNGLAWVYDEYCDQSECEEWNRLEDEARSANFGLWAAPNPIPPWDWRNNSVSGVSTALGFSNEQGIYSSVVTEVIDGDTIKVEGYSSDSNSDSSENGGGCYIRSLP